MGLKQQVVKGVSWNFIDQISRQVISVGVTAVLARILSPNDYGLVALSAIFIGFLSLFSDLCIGSALIQKKDIDDQHISTSFWTSLATGTTIAIVLCGIAPFVARYYEQPLLTYIIDISAVSFVISTLWSTHKILLSRKLEFNKIAAINILFASFSAVSSLMFALSGLGVWSLVLGGLLASVMITPAVWYFEKWRPKFVFDRRCFRELFSFSSYLLSSNIIVYFARNTDNLIVGKYLGAGILGIYSMSYNLMMKPLQQISWSITAVLFPAFSSIQNDISSIRSGYLKVVKGIASITFPMMMGLMMVCREFILVMIGPKWVGVVEPLQVLCLVGAMQSISTTVGAIFNSLGRSDLQFKTSGITSILHVIGFIICIRWGLMGLVKGYLVTNIFAFIFSQYFALRLINLSIKEFIFALTMPAVNSGIMMMALMGYRYLDGAFMHLGVFSMLVSSVSIGTLVYILFTLMFMNRKDFYDLKQGISRVMPKSSVSIVV